jgi:hypothetical protein
MKTENKYTKQLIPNCVLKAVRGGEMTQTWYAYMNKGKKRKQ